MKLSLSCLLLASSLCAASAHASAISGTVYTGIPNWNDASDPTNETAAKGSATFTVNGGGINYAAPPATYQVGSYLNGVTFSNVTGNFTSTTTANNIELILTGTLTLKAGDTLAITHDDGAVLFLNGVNVINSPYGTSAITSPYTVTSAMAGTDTFKLEYAEGNGSPADLNFSVNGLTVGQTPEPSSLMLLGTGIATAAGFVRRRISRKA